MANTYIHMNAQDYQQGKRLYFDLNYIPTITTNVEITMRINGNDFNYGDTYLFGMNRYAELWSPDGGYGARIRTDTTPDYYFEPTYGDTFMDQTWQITPDTDFIIRFDQTSVADTFIMYANGQPVQELGLVDSLQNLSLFLFAANNTDSYLNYACPEEWIKEIKIYEGNTLKRDYVPKKQNGIVGLKDKVVGRFYAPIGSGGMVLEGIYKPDIVIPPLPAQPHKQLITFNNTNYRFEQDPIICPEPIPTDNRLRFEALENSTFGLGRKASVSSVQYSLDNGNIWTELTTNDNVSLNAGQVALIRGKITGNLSTSDYTKFSMTGNIACKGNIMYLYDYENLTDIITYVDAFIHLFESCSSLTSAPALPAISLANYCYYNMFYGCTSLTEAPALPATRLAGSCYDSMFQGCTALSEAPALPATSLANYCYNYMFGGCTSLTDAPALPATSLADYCYIGMFQDCTALSEAPALPATSLADSCYQSMFNGCTSLTEAPALPATSLATYCYDSMFYGCSSLTNVTHHITNWNTDYTFNWLYNVAASGIVRCPANSSIPSDDPSGIPSGWTRENL